MGSCTVKTRTSLIEVTIFPSWPTKAPTDFVFIDKLEFEAFKPPEFIKKVSLDNAISEF